MLSQGGVVEEEEVQYRLFRLSLGRSFTVVLLKVVDGEQEEEEAVRIILSSLRMLYILYTIMALIM